MATTSIMDDLPPGVVGPRPYPYPRPQPPPPMPLELSAPLSCYKCHAPEEALPLPESQEIYAAESCYRQILTSTWRTHLDVVEANELANYYEPFGVLEAWVGEYLESVDALDKPLEDPHLKDKASIEANRDGLKICMQKLGEIYKSMADRMETALKRVMLSVLNRMGTLGYGSYCFHDILKATAHSNVVPYAPMAPPAGANAAANFASGLQRTIATRNVPNFKKRMRAANRWGDWLEQYALDAYPAWRALLVECCKREHHKSMYDIQLMMVGGFSLKLLELGWRELRIDKRVGKTVEGQTKAGFRRVVKWCEAGGVRVALWEKGERERIDKERKKYAIQLESEVEERKKREKAEKEAKKKAERQERRRKRDQDRYEEVLGRMVAIDKERRALLQESDELDKERVALEAKLAPPLPASPAQSNGLTKAPVEVDSSADKAATQSQDTNSANTTASTLEPLASGTDGTAPLPADDAAAAAALALETRKNAVQEQIRKVIVYMSNCEVRKSAAVLTRAAFDDVLKKETEEPPERDEHTVDLELPNSTADETVAFHDLGPAAASATSVGASQSSSVRHEVADDAKSPALPTIKQDAPSVSSNAQLEHNQPATGSAAAERTTSLTQERLTTSSDSNTNSLDASAGDVIKTSGASSPKHDGRSVASSKVTSVDGTTAPPRSTTWASLVASKAFAVKTADVTSTSAAVATSAPLGDRRIDFSRAEAVWEDALTIPTNVGVACREILARIAPEDFTQGCSRDLERLSTYGARSCDIFWRVEERHADGKKGKARALAPPALPPCTCGADKNRRHRRQKMGRCASESATTGDNQQLDALETSTTAATAASHDGESDRHSHNSEDDDDRHLRWQADIKKDTLGSNLLLAKAMARRHLSLPHVCPADVHTSDATNRERRQPMAISGDVSCLLATAALKAYSLAVRQVYAEQAFLLFQSSTVNIWSQLWKRGADPARFLEGHQQEMEAVEYSVRDLMHVVDSKAFQERVARLALRVTINRLVEDTTAVCSDLLTPTAVFQDLAPCLCLLDAHQLRLAAITTLYPLPARENVSSAFPFYDDTSTEAVKAMYLRDLPAQASDDGRLDDILEAHKKCFDIFHSHASQIDAAEFLAAKHLSRLLAAQGGVRWWRMATRHKKALNTHEGGVLPAAFWEVATTDAGLRPEDQVFRAENILIQINKLMTSIDIEGNPEDPREQPEQIVCRLSLGLLLQPRPNALMYLARAQAHLRVDSPWNISEAMYDAELAMAMLSRLPGSAESPFTAQVDRLKRVVLKRMIEHEEATHERPLPPLHNPLWTKDPVIKSTSSQEAVKKHTLDSSLCPLDRCKASTNSERALVHQSLKHRPFANAVKQTFVAALLLEIGRTFKDEIHAVITDVLWQAQRNPKAPPLSEIANDPEQWIMQHLEHLRPSPIETLTSFLSTGEDRWPQMVRLLQRAAWSFRQVLHAMPNMPASSQCLCVLSNESGLQYLQKMRKGFEHLARAVPAPRYPDDARKKLRRDVEEWCKRRNKAAPDDAWFAGLDRIQGRAYAAMWQTIREQAIQLDAPKQFLNVVQVISRQDGIRLYQLIAGAPSDPQSPAFGEAEEFLAFVHFARDWSKQHDYGRLYLDMANYFCRAEQGESALHHYSAAVAAGPLVEALVGRVELLRKLEDKDETHKRQRLSWIVRDCTTVVAERALSADAFAYRAEALIGLGYCTEAWQDICRSFALRPDHPIAISIAPRALTFRPNVCGHGALLSPNYTVNSDLRYAIPQSFCDVRCTLSSAVPLQSDRSTPLIIDVEAVQDVNGAVKTERALSIDVPSNARDEGGEDDTTSLDGLQDLDPSPAPVAPQVAKIGKDDMAYYPDPRCACPQIRCSGAVPIVENFDQLDACLLQVFRSANQVAQLENRTARVASVRDAILRTYITTKTGWEKGNPDPATLKADISALCSAHLTESRKRGMARADRGLKIWLNAVLVALESLPSPKVQGSAAMRDRCTCLLSRHLDHVKQAYLTLDDRIEELLNQEVGFLPANIPSLLDWCRGQLKIGKIASRSAIWKSAPKWRAQVERLVNAFDDVFIDATTVQLADNPEEQDYTKIALLVGGIATFEAAHRLLLPPDPPEPGRNTPPLVVEDVSSWAAFVACYAPYVVSLPMLGAEQTKKLAEVKVHDAAELFRDGKYLDAIRAYSIAAIWVDDRSARSSGDEARRTLRRTIYGQLSYLRTLFPSNRQWMSAVADATIAIAHSKKEELPTALDLRSTALHGIRHYKFALSDLEDAARIDPVKGASRAWQDRLAEMRRQVPADTRHKSRFSMLLDESLHVNGAAHDDESKAVVRKSIDRSTGLDYDPL